MDRKIPTVALYMDMTKAFDHVDHEILLKKLDAYGVRGNINNLIKSYLSDRQQTTKISRIDFRSKTEITYQSDLRTVKFGVPQGSVLGPLLFLIYINDLPSASNHHMTLFADDSTILFAN